MTPSDDQGAERRREAPLEVGSEVRATVPAKWAGRYGRIIGRDAGWARVEFAGERGAWWMPASSLVPVYPEGPA